MEARVRYRQVLDEVQPHWAIAAAAVAALAAGASAYSGAQAQKKAKRNAANASQLAAQGGGGGIPAATATQFSGGGEDARLGEISKVLKPDEKPEMSAPPPAEPTQPVTTAPPIESGQPSPSPMEKMLAEEQERRKRMGMQ